MAEAVILTGSTGHLGCYLLSLLASSERVTRIYCFNRSSQGARRQTELLTDHGLPALSTNSKITFLTYDLSLPKLGLPEDSYEEVFSTVTLIIHNAWPVDWNRNFSSFESSIRGVSNFIDFAVAARRRPRFAFFSSQAVAGNWTAVPGAKAKVPEREIDDWKVARFGYGQSKLVSERLLARASRTRGLIVSIYRIGQMAGPVAEGTLGSKSRWPQQEWFPSLVTSSNHLKLLPSSLGALDNVDWTPVDVAAQVICETLLDVTQATKSVQYNHIVNPTAIPWSALLPAVGQALGDGTKVVTLPAWVDAVGESALKTSNGDLSQNSAIKLLSFFEQLSEKAVRFPLTHAPSLDVKETAKRSKTLADMDAVSTAWMRLWLQQWGYST